MKTEMVHEIRSLLAGQRILSLGVLRNGKPYVGLLPFVVPPEFSSAIVHVSRLALHAAGLVDGASYSALIHVPDNLETDPQEIRRLTLYGEIQGVARDTRNYALDRELYVRRFPQSLPTFGLADFSLFRLKFAGGRYVGGFARAYSLGPKDIQALSIGHTAG